MTPDQYCQDKAASSGSSFYYSFMFLPAKQRQAIIALYAFCREVDDVVDECSDPGLARIKLQWWRDEIKKTFDGEPTQPVAQALQPTVKIFNLPLEHFLEIIDGMEMDLNQVRYRSFKDLNLYCYRVASVVGLMAAEIFGIDDRKTLDYAIELGTALQLTNILRDVHEDAQRGRIYLPMDELEKFGVSEQDILQGNQTEQATQLMKFQAQRANDFYQKAFDKLPEQDRFKQKTGIIMAVIYQATLHEIEKDNYNVLEQRISLTPIRKLWLAWKTARAEKRRYKKFKKSA